MLLRLVSGPELGSSSASGPTERLQPMAWVRHQLLQLRGQMQPSALQQVLALRSIRAVALRSALRLVHRRSRKRPRQRLSASQRRV